jgi:hypothetical protein
MRHCSWRIQGTWNRAQFIVKRSVAGFGVVGPFGPRDGISLGILPGNSSGSGGSPGSRSGGGISGRGFPGGSSRGGSVGLPGVGGTISGGSSGVSGEAAAIYIATLRWSPTSGRDPVIAAVAIFT